MHPPTKCPFTPTHIHSFQRRGGGGNQKPFEHEDLINEKVCSACRGPHASWGPEKWPLWPTWPRRVLCFPEIRLQCFQDELRCLLITGGRGKQKGSVEDLKRTSGILFQIYHRDSFRNDIISSLKAKTRKEPLRSWISHLEINIWIKITQDCLIPLTKSHILAFCNFFMLV